MTVGVMYKGLVNIGKVRIPINKGIVGKILIFSRYFKVKLILNKLILQTWKVK